MVLLQPILWVLTLALVLVNAIESDNDSMLSNAYILLGGISGVIGTAMIVSLTLFCLLKNWRGFEDLSDVDD